MSNRLLLPTAIMARGRGLASTLSRRLGRMTNSWAGQPSIVNLGGCDSASTLKAALLLRGIITPPVSHAYKQKRGADLAMRFLRYRGQ
jgi:hypothetical protein